MRYVAIDRGFINDTSSMRSAWVGCTCNWRRRVITGLLKRCRSSIRRGESRCTHKRYVAANFFERLPVECKRYAARVRAGAWCSDVLYGRGRTR